MISRQHAASLLDLALESSKAAGEEILRLYKQGGIVNVKGDGSPLTEADLQSNRVLMELLSPSGIPIVSEEVGDLKLSESLYWLVDPLDGTKDFLDGNDEFSVNIGLIEDQRPVLGVVYAPALAELFWGSIKTGAWRAVKGESQECNGGPRTASVSMAKSRFHDHAVANLFAAANNIKIQIPIGSALKYGRLAAGLVDVYPRLVGTSEWDTAAGQAVLEAAGGQMLDWDTLRPLHYGKERRRNGRFIAFRAPYTASDFVYPSAEASSSS